jgi:hypothetical protein
MRLFHSTIEALATAQKGDRDGFEVVDEVVGCPKLLHVRSEVKDLADLAEEDPLIRAADRYMTLRKFAPALIEALTFRAGRANDPMLMALRLLADLNQSRGSATCRRTRQCHSVRSGSASSGNRIARTVGCTRPRSSRRCATSCDPATSGSSDRRTIGASTAIYCRLSPCRRSRRTSDFRRRLTNGWRAEDANSTDD